MIDDAMIAPAQHPAFHPIESTAHVPIEFINVPAPRSSLFTSGWV
jgi:hypothetical protein